MVPGSSCCMLQQQLWQCPVIDTIGAAESSYPGELQPASSPTLGCCAAGLPIAQAASLQGIRAAAGGGACAW